jgi:glucose/arabinose dehydrogenase
MVLRQLDFTWGNFTWASLAGLLLTMTSASAQQEILTGELAFGGWRSDSPGVRRLITADDLPRPFATRSAGPGPGLRARPAGVVPQVPPGFTVNLFADDLAGPRTLTIAPNGDVFVAESRTMRVTVLRPTSNGEPVRSIFADGLNVPYGIAFYPPGQDPDWIYIAETSRVIRYPYRAGDMSARGTAEVIIPALPVGGHWTRDIAFSLDGSRLYVAVGSRSNAAVGMEHLSPQELQRHADETVLGAAWGNELDRAAVLTFTPSGERLGTLATGIRNCSGVAIQPDSGALWCATNERDGMGDDLPPDYATSVGEGRFYGWPWFYIGGNEDDRSANRRPELADRVSVPDVLLQPHSAPLGITFYDGATFPARYRGDGFVAMHGSWNRTRKTGYKVVRLIMENGVATGAYEDFMTGFVISDRAVWGRPVGVAVMKDGALLVSEDGGHTIWRVQAE